MDMKTYRAAVIGCGRMGGFIDNEVIGTPGFISPYSHGGGFYCSDRTELVACSDFREDLMEEFGKRYEVQSGSQYVDYKEMLETENLDIVSVATHVEHHAEIVIALAEAGVKAIYCEKGLASSLDEANAMAEACNRNKTILNMGTQRRYDSGFWKMKEIIDSGEIGRVQNLIMTYSAGLFDHGCHVVDLLMYLIDDPHAVWVQGHAPQSESIRDGTVYSDDPGGDGVVLFDNDVMVYLIHSNRYEYQVNCEKGTLGTYNDTKGFFMRKGEPREFDEIAFPEYAPMSSTVNLINDLARALDSGEPPLGGIESARHGVEVMAAILESHLQGGKRIIMPLEKSSLRMNRTNRDAWQKGPRWREPKLSI